MDTHTDSFFGTARRGWFGRIAAVLVSCAVALCVFAQPARAALQTPWTAIGFFEYVRNNSTGSVRNDAVNALAVINSSAGSSVSRIASYTNIGNAYDASSLYCLYTGLTYLDYCNSIRATRGLSAFGTNCTLHAMSIVMCNYAQRFGGHSNAYSSAGVHEALAWGGGQRNPTSVYQSWYYGESDSGSHRRNVIGSYNASGFAIAANGSGTMTYMYEQSFQKTSANTKVYSISEFRQLLKAYIARCLAEGMPLGNLSSSEFAGSVSTVKHGLIVEGGVTHGYSDGTQLVNAWGYFGGKYYHFDSTGALEKNTWIAYGNTWFWLGSDGAVATNTWVEIEGAWYWLNTNGAIATSTWVQYRGSWYWLGSDGLMATSTWVHDGGSWYWVGADGSLQTDTWVRSGSTWYRLGANGAMLSNTWAEIDGTWYRFGSNGALVTSSWVSVGGAWYWIGADGIIATNTWVSYGGSWYWLGEDGTPYANTQLEWGGNTYTFGPDGRLITA